MTEPPARRPAAAFEDKLAALRAAYRRALPEQLDALATLLEAAGAAMATGAVEDAWRLAHRLKGTSGSYGFSELAARARDDRGDPRARATHALAGDEDERARAVARARAARGRALA